VLYVAVLQRSKGAPSLRPQQCMPHLRLELRSSRQCNTRHRLHDCEPTRRWLLRYCIAVTSQGAASLRVQQTLKHCLHSRALNDFWVTWQVIWDIRLMIRRVGMVSRACHGFRNNSITTLLAALPRQIRPHVRYPFRISSPSLTTVTGSPGCCHCLYKVVAATNDPR
jgi:hypothetical protein